MSQQPARPARRPLPAAHGSLAYGVPPSESGTIFVMAFSGGVALDPGEDRRVRFGRNRPDVDVCVGEDDPRVSRTHGTLRYHGDRWWVRTVGRLPVRVPPSRLLTRDEDPLPLDDGYTPLFVRGSGRREHLLEVFVAGADGRLPTAQHTMPTLPPTTWRLSEPERLALVVLAQRYLRHEPFPQPVTWRDAADELDSLQPDAGWAPKTVERFVERVRTRLSRAGGVAGLTRDEVGEPVGNTLNHNLISELLGSTTLVPFDLGLLKQGLDEPRGTGPGEDS